MLGLKTRAVSLALAPAYLVLFFVGPLQQGPYTHRNGADPILLNAFFLLYLAAAGGGAWSLDRLRHARAEAAADSRWAPYALGLLRIAAGGLFLMHGLEKYFGVGGGRIDRDPLTMRGLAGMLEMVGGPLLILGLFTRPVAFVLSGEMAVAYFRNWAPRGFWASFALAGMEASILLCFLFLFLSAAGAGAWSLDARRPGRLSTTDYRLPSRKGATMRAVSLFVAAAFLAIVIPTASITAEERRQGVPGDRAQSGGAPVGTAEAGRAVWATGNTSCRNCHGGEGEGAFALALAGRKLAFERFRGYVRTPKGRMPAYIESELTDQEIADLVAYFDSLPAAAKPSAWRTELPAGATGGQELAIAKIGCGQCHGATFSTPRHGAAEVNGDFEWFKRMVYDHTTAQREQWAQLDPANPSVTPTPAGPAGRNRIRMGNYDRARLPEATLKADLGLDGGSRTSSRVDRPRECRISRRRGRDLHPERRQRRRERQGSDGRGRHRRAGAAGRRESRECDGHRLSGCPAR